MNHDIWAPQRFSDESQLNYRERQKGKAAALKQQKQGRIFWDSYTKGQYKKGV